MLPVASCAAEFQQTQAFTLESSEDYVVQYLGMISGIQRGTDELITLVDEQKVGNVPTEVSPPPFIFLFLSSPPTSRPAIPSIGGFVGWCSDAVTSHGQRAHSTTPSCLS